MANEQLDLVPWEEEQEEDKLELAPWEQPRKVDNKNIPRQAGPIQTTRESGEAPNTSGEFLGIPTQKGINEQGEPRSYLNPLPTEDQYNIPVVGTAMKAVDTFAGEGAAYRMATGSILEAMKAPLELGEALAEYVGLDPNDEKNIRENFPTMPANSGFEKAVQEIGSMIIGGATGSAVGAKLASAVGPQAAKLAGPMINIWSKMRNTDPTNAPKKFELFLKAIGLVGGEIVGTSLTTPSDVEPLSEQWGIVPESDNNFAGNIVDNAMFMGGVKGVAIALRKLGVAGLVEKLTSSVTGKHKKPDAQTMRWLQAIDTDITPDLPEEEIKRRASILADVIQKHSMFEAALSGRDIPIDTTTSMAMGAKEYARRAYNFQEAQLGAKGFSDFVESKAQDFIQQVSSIKKSLAETPSVAKSDAALSSSMAGELDTAANRIATPAQGNAAGQKVAQPAVDKIQDAKRGIDSAQAGVEMQTSQRLADYDSSHVGQLLEDARQQGAFSRNPLLSKLTGDELYSAWQQAKTRVDQAFANIPPQQVDPTELAQLISDSQQVTNILQDVNIPASAGGMSPVDDIEELAKSLEAKGVNDVAVLIQDIRPKLSQRITAAMNNNDPDAAAQIRAFRDGLDALVNKNGDPDIQRAFDTYKDFADKWLVTEPLSKYDQTARTVKDYGGGPRGIENVHEAGAKAFELSKEAYHDGYIQKFVEALDSEVPGADERVSQALVAEGINTILKAEASLGAAGKGIDSNVVWNAIEPHLKAIEAVNPQEALRLRDTIEQLRMADAGLVDKENVLAEAKRVYTESLNEAKQSAARFFIANLTGNGEIATKLETGAGFKELFSHKDAPNIVQQLMQRMASEGDDLAAEGIKSEFLRYLQDRYFSGVSIGMDAEGQAIRDVSRNNLRQAVESNASNDVELIKQVFDGDPEIQAAIYELMQLGNLTLNIRGSRPNPFGSNTAMDTTIRQGINALVNFTVGPLNRTGTRLKSAGALLTQGIEEARQAAAREILGNLSTNSNDAIYALKYFANDPKGLAVPDQVRIYTSNLLRGMSQPVTSRVPKAVALGQRGTDDDQTGEAFNLDEYMDENKFYFDEQGYIKKQGLYSDPEQGRTQ